MNSACLQSRKNNKGERMLFQDDANALLRTAMAHPGADFRPGQWEAIDHIVNRSGKVLCIQRTGWGKSMVYFIAAKALRGQGYGVTLIISPLLALMRNQMEAAARIGLKALTINSTNTDDWRAVRQALLADQADLLLISPERLANDEFVESVLQPIAARIGLLVVDEAHCISDWGHDFRPDYRRIGQILNRLPSNIAVLATTATANHRVEADVSAQLGANVQVQRGPLMRESLELQVLLMPSTAERLAWLATHMPSLPGAGIVYTLTTRDAERVARWLQQNGIKALHYHSDVDSHQRERMEQDLSKNRIKCLVATSALGMGYDKPDLGFVIHYQTPGNVVAYYQQVGRAGRAIPKAYGILMTGEEDEKINRFFRDSAFPPHWQVERILQALEQAEDGLKTRGIERAVNLRPSQIEKVLKLLVVEPESPVMRLDGKWYRTPNDFALDFERIEHLTHQREMEWEQMQAYVASPTCSMQFLATALDDASGRPCGRCAVCTGHPLLPSDAEEDALIAARRFVRHSEILMAPKKQWDTSALPQFCKQQGWRGANIPDHLRNAEGRVLSRWGEPVWGALVAEGKAAGRFDDQLVAAAADLIRNRWAEGTKVRWVTCIPSLRHPKLVSDFARRLADALGLAFSDAIQKVQETEPQKSMENRYHQCSNLDGVFAVNFEQCYCDPVLLVDDAVDSGWTLTLAGALLRSAGTGPVLPFALASTTAK